ncbi:insulinase family protein [Pelotomaculum terephthalicicum JT]|uniref:M16 family metallopeptidase n=1 Tax=Pelotomaculum TaxID=191373 RepID=UPI0009CEAF69|nr:MULTISPECIES: pitrilysin family protein [Pelotomaculum]MCG9967756.1 insulinase family protein [Pelotomaculum terephthalicicum JT]OPX85374.1 MAG: Protease 3 precursor [Pelotomaculum sp. PtaB.Bin117]OPY62693.1 MAG: Protease 3 precursor [Pelotomaculum sp. PtaU1.Bin065]
MFHKVTLDNNIHILLEQVPHVRSVALGFWVDVGSRYESSENNGISHFIEHLLFKGTERRTAKQIAETLDAVGGQLNAFTTKEYTCYYARVLDEYFDLAVDLLSDMLFYSKFAPDDIDRERNVIVEEIKMYEDAPDELVHDIFAGSMWQGHALGRPIIGTAEVIEQISRDKIVEFYNTHYKPGNLVVTAAGNIDKDEVINKLRPVLETRKGYLPARDIIAPAPKRDVVCRSKETEQVHLCIGTPGLSLENEKTYTFQVLNTILGGGLSSRLFQEIREQRGLVYSVYSYHSSYHDTGLFCIYAGLSKQNVDEVLELIFKQVEDIRLNSVKSEELQRAKDQLKGNLLLSLENVSTRMSRLGKSQLYLGKVIPPEEVVEKINKVTIADIQELAAEMLKPGDFSMATIGPWTDCGNMEKMLSRYGSQLRRET